MVAADYNYGQITSQWVKKYAGKRRRGASIDFFRSTSYHLRSDHFENQAAKPTVWSALVGGAHISFYRQWAAAGMRKSIPMASTTFAVGNEHIVLSPDECNGMLICYNYSGPEEPGQREVRGGFPAFRCRLSEHHRTRDGNLSGFPAVGGSREEGRQHRPHQGDRGVETGISIDAPSGKSRSTRRRIIACSTSTSPRSPTRN